MTWLEDFASKATVSGEPANTQLALNSKECSQNDTCLFSASHYSCADLLLQRFSRLQLVGHFLKTKQQTSDGNVPGAIIHFVSLNQSALRINVYISTSKCPNCLIIRTDDQNILLRSLSVYKYLLKSKPAFIVTSLHYVSNNSSMRSFRASFHFQANVSKYA